MKQKNILNKIYWWRNFDFEKIMIFSCYHKLDKQCDSELIWHRYNNFKCLLACVCGCVCVSVCMWEKDYKRINVRERERTKEREREKVN